MSDISQLCSKIVDLVENSKTECVKLSEVLTRLVKNVREELIDKVARELHRSGRLRVYFSTRDCDYYICKRSSSEQNGKLTMQKIVDLLRDKFDSELVPKPQVLDFLKELVPERFEQIYNVLVRDGVIEEVNISGMVFVKIAK